MTYWDAIKVLHKHLLLSDRRSLKWKANTLAKFFYYVLAIIFCGYLGLMAMVFATMAREENTAGYQFVFFILPPLLILDYVLRTGFNQKTILLVRPYLLLPIPKYASVDYLIIREVTRLYNLSWLFFIIPFGLFSGISHQGIGFMIGYTVACYLFFLINGLFFLLTQTLTTRHSICWLLPAGVYTLLTVPPFLTDFLGDKADFYSQLGYKMATHSLPTCAILLLILVLLAFINRKIIFRYVYEEQFNGEKSKANTNLHLTFLEHFHDTGEFLKLEVRSIMRNKNIRKAFFMGTLAVIIYSCLIIFNNDVDLNTNSFYLTYSFSIYGVTILSKIMCYEGNYMECLIMQRKSIYQLLLAKYYFYSVLQIIPFLVFLPAVFMGRLSFWTLLSYALFATGACYFILFQMAIYNKVAIPLNQSLTGKTRSETPYIHIFVTTGVLLVPLLLIAIGNKLLKMPTATNLVMALIGLFFITTHQLWIARICRRMEKRKYEQLEGFRTSR